MENYNYTDLEKYRDQIEAIKIMVIGLPATCQTSPCDVLVNSIRYMYNISQVSEKDYKHQILILMHTYLELGFNYEANKVLFDDILDAIHINKNLQFRKKYLDKNKVFINRSNIQKIIGRWPETDEQGYTSEKIVDIIMDKLYKNDIGIYDFICRNKNNIMLRYLELVVLEREIYLHDVLRKQYHILYKRAG